MKYKMRTSNSSQEIVDVNEYLFKLLEERGIDCPSRWLNASKDDENDSSLLKNIDLCCELLHETLTSELPIVFIQADSDTDGYTSSAIIHRFINAIADYAIVDVNLHEGKQHGVNLSEALKSKAKLIIIPDAGTNETSEQEEISKHGKNFIILDHHELSNKVSIEDKPIVNSQVDYPNKGLSGAGVALKFCQHYARKYSIEINEDMLYGLAAIGIVADVMDLQNLENKFIINHGLSKINNHNFLRELLKDRMGNCIEHPTQKDIGWTIGPNINAVIRLGTLEQKRMLYDSLVEPDKNVISGKRGDDDVVIPLYLDMVRICKNVKSRQSTLIKKGMGIIQGCLDDNQEMLNNNLIVYIDRGQELPFELSGLIANKLLSQYKRPVILLRHFREQNNPNEQWRGSVRGIAAEGCENLKSLLSTVSGVDFAEGHAFACGIGIDKEAYDSFYAHAISLLNQVDFNSQLYTIDSIMDIKTMNLEIARLFANENIWGQGIEKPLALLQNIDCARAEFMGAESQHVKISTDKVNIVMFDNKSLVNSLMENRNMIMNAIGEFSWDTFESEPKLQFVVQDYELEENDDVVKWSDF